MTESNQDNITEKEIKSFINNLDETTSKIQLARMEISQAIDVNIEQTDNNYITVYDLCFFIKKTAYPNWNVRGGIINNAFIYDLPKFVEIITILKRKIVIQCEQVKLYIKSMGIYGGFNEFSNITICKIFNLLIDGWHYLLKNGYIFPSYYDTLKEDFDPYEQYGGIIPDLFETLTTFISDGLENLYIPREIAETVFNYPKLYRPDGYNEQKDIEAQNDQLKAELEAKEKELQKVVADLEKAKKDLNSRKRNNSTIETKDQVIEGLCYMVQRETNLKETWKHLNIQNGIITKTSLSKVLYEILKYKLNVPTSREYETIIKNVIDTKNRD